MNGCLFIPTKPPPPRRFLFLIVLFNFFLYLLKVGIYNIKTFNLYWEPFLARIGTSVLMHLTKQPFWCIWLNNRSEIRNHRYRLLIESSVEDVLIRNLTSWKIRLKIKVSWYIYYEMNALSVSIKSGGIRTQMKESERNVGKRWWWNSNK